MDGPPYTVLDAVQLTDGRIRVLVRKRGGRRVRLIVAAVAGNGDDIAALINRVLADWPDLPSRDY